MKALFQKSSLVFLFCFISYSVCHSAAKPKPSTEAFPNLAFENIEDYCFNPSSTYLPTQKNQKSKKGFFKSLFKKKKKAKKNGKKLLKPQTPDNKAMLALIFGGLSLLFIYLGALYAFSFLISIGFAVAGLIMGISALKNKTIKKGMAISGIVMSGVTIALYIIAILYVLLILIALSGG